ncbi:MAG: transglutaminase domain-containing protein [Eubacteriales bacterium]|nr:transglutaminase domain-containing protein [Eubacteriales bacterium]
MKQHPKINYSARASRQWSKRIVWMLLLALLTSHLTACRMTDQFKSDLSELKEPVGELLDQSSKVIQSVIEQVEPTEEIIDPVEESTGSPAQTTTHSTTSSTQKADAGEDFDDLVTGLIQDALNNYRGKAVLDTAMTRYRFTEAQSDELISRVYDLYEQVFRRNPQYYWLDGSARITYSILQTEEPTFSAMTLEMGYTPGFATATADILKSRQDQLLATARSIADVASDAGEPWQQLMAVHDILVRNIVYDTTLNQENNNAASALLEHLTLCQGYAQSFQLITQALGFEVTLITGTSDNVDHAWNLVWLDGQPYHVDVTHDDPVPDGGANDQVAHVHFLRSDAIMQQSHIWTAENYPLAETDGAQSFRSQGLVVASIDELDARIGAFVSDADLQDNEPNRLELLYIGNDIPSKETVEAMLIAQLRERSGVRSIVYRASVEKSVITLELLPS